jgi:ribonuclease HI
MQALGRLSKLNRVTLLWTPGHQGIPGNKEADWLANEGTTEVPPNQFTATLLSVGKKTHQEAFGTETSGQVLTVQNADEMSSVY